MPYRLRNMTLFFIFFIFLYFNTFEDKQVEFCTKCILYQYMSNDALPNMSGCFIVVVVLFPCFSFVCLV